LIFISNVWYKSGREEQRRRESITAKATDFASVRLMATAIRSRVQDVIVNR
jgi:hypothetical protein